ncbi:MAG: hypothetical protein ABIE84_05015 [bacterium]
MSINYVDSSANHQMSVALNQGALDGLPKELLGKDKEADNITRHRSGEELDIAKLATKNNAKELTVSVLKPFFAKLATAGIMSGPKAKAEKLIEKEYGLREAMDDSVEISSADELVKQIGKMGKQGSGGAGSSADQQQSQEEMMALLKEYAAMFTDYVASQSPTLADKLKDLKDRLIAKGFSEAKLQSLEAKLSSGGKLDLLEAVKESVILQVLSSDTKLQKAIHGRGMMEILVGAGLSKEQMKEVVAEAKGMAREELRSFTLHELENELIKRTHLQDNDFEYAQELVKLGEKVGANPANWLQNHWPGKRSDHGFDLMDVPHSVTGMNVNTGTDQQNDQPKKHGFEFEANDEKDIQINRLRALYMQRALKGDMITHLNTEFKIRKLKNGLFKLGIFTEELDDQIMHEAEVVAKIKTIEMLKEGLVERSTFYELAGPAHKLNERKIKGLLKNAERLGMTISPEEFNSLRDKSNIRVFDLSKKELADVRLARLGQDSDRLVKKEKFLLKLLYRLKEESAIQDSIPENC